MFAALVIVVPATVLFLVWFYLFRNTTDIPVSPGAKPIVGHMHHFFDLTKDTVYKFEERYFKITDPKNGAVSHMKFFFKSNFSLNTVRVAEPLLKSNVNINKSFQYDDIAGWLKDSVLILPGQEWQKRRHILTPAFHFNILDDFTVTMKKHSKILIDKIRSNPERPIVKALEEVTFYSLCETSFGVEFSGPEESDVFLNCMQKIVIEFINKAQNPLNRYDWFYGMTASGKRTNAAVNEMNERVMELVNARKKDLELGETKLHKGKRGFLDQLVYEQAHNGDLTDEQIVGECNTIMLAGHGTTTGTTAFCLYYLCKHQDVQERLYQEIADHLKGKTFEDIDVGSIPYLGMVVKETLRLQPPASFVARILSEPMEADGHVLPTGSNVDVSIWWIHRDPEHWENPEVFNPERFSVENSRNRNPYAFVPFSAGPRNCIGQRFANLETRLLVAAIVYHYKMSTEQELGKELVRDIHGVSSVPGPNFNVDLVSRR